MSVQPLQLIIVKSGDIYLTDSVRLGPRIVKFLMQEPTIWHQIYHFFANTLNKVDYYHAGLVVSPETCLEQQWKVQAASVKDAIYSKQKYVIYRKTNLTTMQFFYLSQIATGEVGKSYDLLLILGKFATWLTGIKWFVRHCQQPNKEICVTRVAWWFYRAGICKFGKETWHEITTDIIDDYCKAHPLEWEVVYRKEG